MQDAWQKIEGTAAKKVPRKSGQEIRALSFKIMALLSNKVHTSAGDLLWLRKQLSFQERVHLIGHLISYGVMILHKSFY